MSNEQHNLSELIDSCRRADDLQLPELQPLATAIQADPQVDRRLKKSQRIDAVIGQSIRDVPIPTGFEDRLFAALAFNQQHAESIRSTTELGAVNRVDSEHAIDAPDQLSAVGNTEAQLDVVKIAPRRVARFRWKSWVVGITSAAAALIAFFAFSDPAPSFDSENEVAIQAQQWLKNLNDNQWTRSALPSQRFPVPSQGPLAQPYRWQWVANTHSTLKVACYNFPSTKSRAHLFVCRGARDPRLPSLPPTTPTGVASGWLVGSWQSGDVVYVLAVEGKVQQYKALIGRTPRMASTARWRARS